MHEKKKGRLGSPETGDVAMYRGLSDVAHLSADTKGVVERGTPSSCNEVLNEFDHTKLLKLRTCVCLRCVRGRCVELPLFR